MTRLKCLIRSQVQFASRDSISYRMVVSEFLFSLERVSNSGIPLLGDDMLNNLVGARPSKKPSRAATTATSFRSEKSRQTSKTTGTSPMAQRKQNNEYMSRITSNDSGIGNWEVDNKYHVYHARMKPGSVGGYSYTGPLVPVIYPGEVRINCL